MRACGVAASKVRPAPAPATDPRRRSTVSASRVGDPSWAFRSPSSTTGSVAAPSASATHRAWVSRSAGARFCRWVTATRAVVRPTSTTASAANCENTLAGARQQAGRPRDDRVRRQQGVPRTGGGARRGRRDAGRSPPRTRPPSPTAASRAGWSSRRYGPTSAGRPPAARRAPHRCASASAVQTRSSLPSGLDAVVDVERRHGRSRERSSRVTLDT